MLGPESSQRGRNDGKRGLAQGWIPLQKQDRRLLRLLEQGPERTLFRGLEQKLSRALAPGVYFVLEEPQASSHKPQAIRKVVVTR